MLGKNVCTALAIAVIALAIIVPACSQPQPTALSVKPAPSPQPPAAETPTATPTPQPSEKQTAQPAVPPPPVRILQVHYRGSLQPLGCCNPGLYEKDEFVAIQNTSTIPQNITGWKLVNITRGYPTFTFPVYFPCIPFAVSKESKYVVNTQNYVSNAPKTVEQLFTVPTPSQGEVPPDEIAPTTINWAGCAPPEPLDQTPMGLKAGQQQGLPVPCTLYPGQIILVFTDEIHCQYGGLSFNYGYGNLWDNEKPDTAVLYNSQGEEVSRRSYSVGK